MKTDRTALLAGPAAVLLAAGIAWAGSQGGATVAGVPVFAIVVALAFLIQLVAFVPAYLGQSERFFDSTGSLTYVLTVSAAAALSAPLDTRSMLLAAVVVLWAGRLGVFLYRRVRRAGKDGRFDEIKPSFIRFLNV